MPSEVIEMKTLNDKCHGLITDIHVDSSNYVWVLSSREVLQFDGSKIRKYHPANYIGSLALEFFNDAFGRLWVADYGGNLAYVQDDSLYAYPHNDSTKNLIYRGAFEMLEYDKDSILHLGTRDKGYYKMYPDGRLEEVIGRSSGLRGYMAIAREGKAPFMFSIGANSGEKTSQRYFYLMNSDLSIKDSLPIDYKGTRTHSSFLHHQNGMYLFSTGMKNLLYFNNERIDHEFEYEHPIIHLMQDSKGGLWVSTKGHGLDHYLDAFDLENESVHYFPEETAAAYVQDGNDGIWIKSNSLEICHIPNLNFSYFSDEEGLNKESMISKVSVNQDFAFIFSNGTIQKVYRNGNVENIPSFIDFIDPSQSRDITMMYYDSISDKLWVGGLGLYAFYKNEKWTILNMEEELGFYGILRGWERDVFDTSLVNIYLNHFFMQYRGDSLVSEINTNRKNIRDIVRAPDGKIWIGSADGLGVLENGEYTHYGTKNDYFYYDVGGLMYYKDRLWIRNGSSLSYLDTNDSLHFAPRYLSVDYMFPHEEEGFWIHSCCSGIIHCYVDENDSVVYQSYNTSKSISLSYSETSFQWGDTLYLGSVTGMHVGVISKLDTVQLKTQLLLDKVLINSKYTALSSSYTLDHTENYIQVNFNSINYEPNENGSLFRYKMEGLKEEWYETREHFAQFTALDPGDYTFLLQGKTDWVDYGETLSIKFTIKPPFWQTWWFISTCILALVMLVVLVFRYQLKIEKRKDKLLIDKLLAEQKTLRAQLNPHFIFNSLTSIQQLVFNNDRIFATENIAVFAKLMRKVLILSEKEWVNLTEELEVLELYLKLESLRFEEDLIYEVEVSSNIDDETYQVPSLLLQPLVENAVKHGLLKRNSPGAKVSIRVYKTPQYLCLEVEDNGVGVSSNENERRVYPSFGLSSVRKRIELLNVSLKTNIQFEINSVENEGTKVQIRLPLNLKMIEQENSNEKEAFSTA
jgi:two-component sensor histidine kinase